MIGIILIAVLVVVFLFFKGIITMKTKASVVNESSYLKNNCIRTMQPMTEADSLLHPFSMVIDPMDKLIVFDIEDDQVYNTIELQVFDDEVSQGLIVLMFRTDNEIDVYYTLGIKHDLYKGSTNGSFKEFAPEAYHFDKDDGGLHFLLQFKDRNGTEICIEAHEHHPNKEHIAILAPAGEMVDNFTSFPLFFMKQTAFIEKKYGNITIRIGDVERKPVEIPISINGKFVYLARYCFEPVMVSINENYNGPLLPVDLSKENGLTNYIVRKSSGTQLAATVCNQSNHHATLKFAPAIPDLKSLNDGDQINGRFSTSVDDTMGIVAGAYSLERKKDNIAITFEPKKGWQPMPGKKWFTKYKWTSVISLKDDGAFIDSKWVKGN